MPPIRRVLRPNATLVLNRLIGESVRCGLVRAESVSYFRGTRLGKCLALPVGHRDRLVGTVDLVVMVRLARC